MKSILSIIYIFLSVISHGQKLSQNILGDWVEIRREQRIDYVYNAGGTLLEPSIELSFFKDNTATFHNTQIPEPKSKVKYLIMGDTLLALVNGDNLTVFDIVKISNSEMVIVWRSNKKWKDDNLDQKQYFIRKDKFDKLTTKEKDILKAPSAKDSIYLKDILVKKQKRSHSIETDEVLFFSEISPAYPSGETAMKEFINKTIQRPKSLVESGRVMVSFIVETNGELTNIQIEKSLNPECDNEAIRMVGLMPNWTPGMQSGKKVRVKKFLPITF